VFADNATVKVEISCHNFNFKNFWGGEFLSSYVVELASENISGTAKFHNHYFEQGNIQFNLKKSFPSQKLKTLSAKGIVDAINKLETDVSRDELNSFFSTKKAWRTCTSRSRRSCSRA
jgi:F-actin capping protein alpha subunit